MSIPSPEQLARLSAVADEINGGGAPIPLTEPVLLNSDGFVLLPVPHHDAPIVVDARLTSARRMAPAKVWRELHAGMTLQWSPMPEHGGLLLAWRGGNPDGDRGRDTVASFLTRRGLRAMIADLQAIDAQLDGHLPPSSGAEHG